MQWSKYDWVQWPHKSCGRETIKTTEKLSNESRRSQVAKGGCTVGRDGGTDRGIKEATGSMHKKTGLMKHEYDFSGLYKSCDRGETS